MPPRTRKSKLYTRTGDAGKTGLFGGRRVSKDDPRVAAYGALDELNSAIGLAVSLLRQRPLIAELQSIQNELFDIGAELASDRPVRRRAKSSTAFQLGTAKVERLERLIDAYDAKVPPLTTFVLPSGPPGGAALHLARTVCRRAERATVTLARKEAVNPHVLAYLNRLCDLLFVTARYVNKASRKRELTWRKNA
jgi:cob(I)alamin adenosyltransferase